MAVICFEKVQKAMVYGGHNPYDLPPLSFITAHCQVQLLEIRGAFWNFSWGLELPGEQQWVYFLKNFIQEQRQKSEKKNGNKFYFGQATKAKNYKGKRKLNEGQRKERQHHIHWEFKSGLPFACFSASK